MKAAALGSLLLGLGMGLALAAVAAAEAPPEFALPRYDRGGTVRLADFSGQIVVLDFFAFQAPPPQLTNLRRSGQGIEFSFAAQRGRTNRVEASTNFIHWSVLTNVVGTNALVSYRDTNVLGAARRFYRVRR